MAFGTGTHPTTQLCLELIETQFSNTPQFLGCNVLDIGCGSGILSIAALKLGAGRAFGVDVDPDAIPNAQKNAAANRVADQTQFAVGSVDDIKAGVFEINQAPLVLANILAPILMRLLDSGMGDLISPDGVLILSGILDEQRGDMLKKVAQHKLRVVDECAIEDWVAYAVRR
jgi:ribosomal protein L11 methyltransferase